MLFTHFCNVKLFLIALSFCFTALTAEETGSVSSVKMFTVADVNKELLAGAKVECLGTGYTAYTNSKGECFIPAHILKQAKAFKVESVSYKSRQIELYELSTVIVLQFR